MKILPPFCHLLLLAGLVLALPAHSAAADDASAPASSGVRLQVGSLSLSAGNGGGSPQLVLPKPTPFTLEIRNGTIIENGKPADIATIGNVLDYLKKQGKAFNIILGPGVADLRITDLVLNLPEFNGNVIFEAIASSVEDQVKATTIPDYGIYRLSLREDSGRQSQVFNLTGYLNPDGKADDKMVEDKLSSLTDIIFRTLKDLDPAFSDAVQPHYQFHKGANLLVVIGTPEAISVANQVVNALQPPDGNPQRSQLLNIAASAPTDDPAAQAVMAWAQALQASHMDKTQWYAQGKNLIAMLQSAEQNKSLTAQEVQDLQNKISDLQKILQDADLMQAQKQSLRDLPEITP